MKTIPKLQWLGISVGSPVDIWTEEYQKAGQNSRISAAGMKQAQGKPEPRLAHEEVREGGRTGKMDPKGMNPDLVLDLCPERCNPGYPALPLFPELHPVSLAMPRARPHPAVAPPAHHK